MSQTHSNQITDEKPLPVNIGLNITSAVAGGGVTYLNKLIKYFANHDHVNKYYVYASGNSAIQSFKNTSINLTYLVHKLPKYSIFARIFWEQFVLPFSLKKHSVQILFCPANIGPIFFNFPFVLVVQNIAMFNDDLIRSETPYQKLRLLFLRLLTKHSMLRAEKVIFISKASQKALCGKYGIDYEKTIVIYHGNEGHFHLNQIVKSKTENRYNLEKYILCVSNIYKFKNFYELILAFIKIKDKIDQNMKLVFIGQSFDNEYNEKLQKVIAANSCRDRIKFIGHVPHKDLPLLYAHSTLYAYPSTIESFGKTLIEAMASGATVVASNIEPIPEVCGDAALYFNPNDPDDIAEKLMMALQSDDLRSDLSKLALKRGDFFFWEKTAQETLDTINSACRKI